MLYDVTDSADIGSKGITRIDHSSLSGVGNSTRNLPATEMPKQGKQAQVIHGNDLTCIFFSFVFIVKLLVTGGDCLILTKFHRFARFC